MIVERLHLADFSFPAGHPLAGRTGSVFGFVLPTPVGAILYETGLGEDPEIDELFRPVRRDLEEELAGRGFRLDDVVTIVNSHLHFDHCGGNPRFRGTPIFVQEAELAAARGQGYTLAALVDFPGATYRTLEGEAEIAPGVRVVPTPGHTPGHQSLVVSGDAGVVVFAGQALYGAAEMRGATDTASSGLPSAWDAEAYAASVRVLRERAPRRVLFSHDAEEWEAD